MSDLYHVIYAGTVGIDQESLIALSVDDMKDSLGKSCMRSVDKTSVILVDHPNDIEEVINTLDDMQIPCTNEFDLSSSVYLIASFILKGNERSNSELKELFDRINSERK